MSASREKRERQQNKKPAPVKKTHGLRNGLIVCVAVVLLLYMAASSLGMFHRTFAAASVGDVSFTAAEVNMYYQTAKVQTLNMFGLSDEPGVDEQEFYTGFTFGDYFKQQAQANMQNDGMLSREAEKNGMTLSEESKKEIDDTIAAYREQARQYGVSFQTLMSGYFGEGVTESVFRKVNERSMLAYQWQEKKQEEFSPSTEECEAYYAEHTHELSKAVYYTYSVKWTTEEGATEEEIAEAKEEARVNAELLEMGATSLDALYEGVVALEPDVTKASLIRTAYVSDLATEVHDFLEDSARQRGDHTLLEAASSYDVLVFESLEREDYFAPSYYSVTVTPSDITDIASVQEAWDKADAIFKEWQAGEQTEASFTALAAQKVESDVVTNNGLTENAVKTFTGSEEQAWLYDPARKTGDAAVVDTGSGYKVIYFVKWSDKPYWEIEAQNLIINEKGNEYTTQLTEQYPYKTHSFGQMFVTHKEKKAEPSPSEEVTE